jgi:hypothetical protein
MKAAIRAGEIWNLSETEGWKEENGDWMDQVSASVDALLRGMEGSPKLTSTEQ